MVVKTLNGQNQFTGIYSYIIFIILIVTAVLQVICVNSALKMCDAVTVVPVFFSFYSVLSLINSNVYYDQWWKYTPLNYGLVFPSIAVLIYGVMLLSKSQATHDAELAQLENRGHGKPGNNGGDEEVVIQGNKDKGKEKMIENPDNIDSMPSTVPNDGQTKQIEQDNANEESVRSDPVLNVDPIVPEKLNLDIRKTSIDSSVNITPQSVRPLPMLNVDSSNVESPVFNTTLARVSQGSIKTSTKPESVSKHPSELQLEEIRVSDQETKTKERSMNDLLNK